VGSQSKRHRASRVADGGDGLQLWRIATNIMNTQSHTANKKCSSSLGDWVRGLTIPHRETVMNTQKKITGEVRNACEILVGKYEGKRTRGRPSRRWDDNIRTRLTEIGWKDVDWIHLAQDKDQWLDLVNTVMNLRVLYKAGNFLTSWVTVSLSRSTLLHGVKSVKLLPNAEVTKSQMRWY
jgi:hypothetical protein